MSILHWDKDQPEILDQLRTRSKLKICCKTVSEPELITGWINHHIPIVGAENLIIADNGSLDIETLKIYESIGAEVKIFQFSGPHNDIHWHPRFQPLFELLRETVDFFSFIDVDERLVWIDGDRWTADSKILDRLQENGAIYPTTWLINAIGSMSRFTLLDTEKRPILSNNLRWGKPILPPALIGAQSGIHNIQYVGHQFSTSCGVKTFLLHLTQLPYQRITANIKKLANRGLVEHSIDPESIASMNFSDYPDKTPIRFQREIAEMIAYLKGDEPIANKVTEFLELAEHGVVIYSDAEIRAAFSRYIDDGVATIEEIFK